MFDFKSRAFIGLFIQYICVSNVGENTNLQKKMIFK